MTVLLSVTSDPLARGVGGLPVLFHVLFDGESVQQSAVLPVWMEIYMEHKVFFTNKCHEIIEHIPQVIERPFPV